MSEKNFEITMLRLKPKQLEELKERKNQVGVSVSEQIRIAVDRYLREEGI